MNPEINYGCHGTSCRDCPSVLCPRRAHFDSLDAGLKHALEENDKRMYKALSETAKYDAGKPRLTRVPREIIRAIAGIREYGWDKYGEQSDHWDDVEPVRYRDAAFRHFLAYLDNPKGLDVESGLPHLHHLACNIAFLCELEKEVDTDGK